MSSNFGFGNTLFNSSFQPIQLEQHSFCLELNGLIEEDKVKQITKIEELNKNNKYLISNNNYNKKEQEKAKETSKNNYDYNNTNDENDQGLNYPSSPLPDMSNLKNRFNKVLGDIKVFIIYNLENFQNER